MIPCIYDKRSALQVRIAFNKIVGNKNSINTEISNLICQYSHSTVIERACMFQCGSPPTFMCVARVHSPFWVTCITMPSRVAFFQTPAGTNFGHLHWLPDWKHSGRHLRKRLFDPFGIPFLKCRNQRYHLRHKRF